MFPVIDLPATGANITRLRQERGFSVRDLQQYFGFEEPQAIYKWQRGQSLPTVDNLYALSALLGVSMNDIIIAKTEQQADACCSSVFSADFGRGGHGGISRRLRPLSAISGHVRHLKGRRNAPKQATCFHRAADSPPSKVEKRKSEAASLRLAREGGRSLRGTRGEASGVPIHK